MTQHRTWQLTFLILLTLVLGTTPSARGDDTPYNLGMSAAFTGQSKDLGIELYRGSMAYFGYVNILGGVHGRDIHISTLDDGYNPTPTIENTIQLIETENVLCLYNYVGTPTVTRVLPLIKRYHDDDIFLFFPFTGAQPQRNYPYTDYVFNLRASYNQELKGLVDQLVAIGRTRIAVFYQADAYGRSGWDGVRKALEDLGLRIVGEATYHRGSRFMDSMDEQVDIIEATDPDAIISIGSYAACAAFIRDARDSGVEVPIANVSFVGSESLLKLLESTERLTGNDYSHDLINTQVVPSYEDLTLPAVREYRALMDSIAPPPPASFGEEYTPLKYSFVSFEGFLNAKVMVHILELLGPAPEKQDICSVTESIHDFDIGIDTLVNFGPNQHQGLDVVYFTTVKDGKFVPVRDWSRWSK